MSEQMRKEFEAHMVKQNVCTSLARHRSDDSYRTISVQRAWELWQAALATQPQAPQGGGWINIDERLPESGVRVLVMLSDPEDTGWVVKTPWIALWMNGYWHDCDAIADGCPITHWMPLPLAPTETPEVRHE
jgi:hypothetical protein